MIELWDSSWLTFDFSLIEQRSDWSWATGLWCERGSREMMACYTSWSWTLVCATCSGSPILETCVWYCGWVHCVLIYNLSQFWLCHNAALDSIWPDSSILRIIRLLQDWHLLAVSMRSSEVRWSLWPLFLFRFDNWETFVCTLLISHFLQLHASIEHPGLYWCFKRFH